MKREITTVAILVLASCGGRKNVPCEGDSNCNLFPSGVCLQGPSEMWCAYPDNDCPAGYRFSDLDVGDGVSGECVTNTDLPDAGVDAPADAQVGDGNVTCKPRIAFADGPTGSREVWVTNTDGSGKQNVSNAVSYDDWRPSWSPDGTALVFESNRSGNFDIWKVNADGSGLVNLTPASSYADVKAVWSPDGSKIAFVRNLFPWVMNADGTGQVQVSTFQHVNDLAWSPDSTKIVFGHIDPQSGSPALFVAALSGGTPIQASEAGRVAVGAAWAPNNKIIYYAGYPANDIWSVNGDGSGLFNVTQSAAGESGPHWVPDGTAIVFTSDVNGRREIWRVANTGGTQTQLSSNNLTSGTGTGDFPTDVSSDGLLVAFDRRASETASQIGVIGIDGSNIMLVDAGAGNARGAVFAMCP